MSLSVQLQLMQKHSLAPSNPGAQLSKANCKFKILIQILYLLYLIIENVIRNTP
jgi:hypothetical protein